MERWRIFGLTTRLAVLLLACRLLVSEAGRTRMRAAGADMQHAMARRILVGELRKRVADAALAYQSFLISGRADTLEPLRNAGSRINDIADSLVASYQGEPGSIGTTLRQRRGILHQQHPQRVIADGAGLACRTGWHSALLR
jgi:CHASE3 domain sensor protein